MYYGETDKDDVNDDTLRGIYTDAIILNNPIQLKFYFWNNIL